MNYLVTIFPDRAQAEQAYSRLQQEGLPIDKIDILGNGYTSADEYGLIDPDKPTRQRAIRLANWLIPFGFAAGYLFNFLTGIEILPAIGAMGNHMLGGLFGAIAGAMGAYFVGGAIELFANSKDALAYRDRLNAGEYLIIVKGTEEAVRQATYLLRQFKPENIQDYVEPTGAKV